MIKIYLIKSFAYTPFVGFDPIDLPFFNRNGIKFVTDINEADVLIAQNMKHIKKYIIKYFNKKKYLIWTLEPRNDTHFSSPVSALFGRIKVEVMNVYTGDVFVNPLVFHAKIIDKKLALLSQDHKLKGRKIACLMSYYKGVNSPEFLRDDENIDLINLRSSIAVAGAGKGLIDIYGKGWPKGISQEDSRDGAWKNRKLEILKKYDFNLCFENTIAHNYVTEKIWDAIAGYCLPIYYGEGSGIYQLFREESFIDYSSLKSHDNLFNFIKNLSCKDYIKRMNKCIEAYNNVYGLSHAEKDKLRRESLHCILSRIKSMVNE